MNGLCPACRRPYNDKDIEYKVITPEETAIHRARQVQKQKKNLQAQLKEKQKAEADSLSRKHLAGLRVVQKNLVYVTGLSPKLQEEELLHTLRGDTYFGQYGKIIKIVVSKARDRLDSVGVYVTYEKKDDAASCIQAVDGSPNGDRTLRAQFGTTKYCSAYLRGDACMNRNCMFLHEAGEAGESYSRADLSSMNAGSTQQGSKQAPPQSQQPMSAATPMVRTASDQPQSPTLDRPALPSTASWASRPMHTQPSRTESRNVSGSIDSPALPAATPAVSQPTSPPPAPAPESEEVPAREPTPEPSPEPSPEEQPAPQPVRARKPRTPSPIRDLLKLFRPQDLCLEFSTANMPQSEIDILTSYPALFDSDGGAKRRLRRQKEEEQRRIELEQAAAQIPNIDTDDNPEMSGSMQLGGEPDEQDDIDSNHESATASGQEATLDQRFQFGGVSSPAGISERGLTPQQHQQLLLQTMKSPSPGSQGTYLNQSNTFQQGGHAPGHQRNVSRFSFANDSSASTAVKPVANQKLMSQQSAMMPPNGSNHFGGQQTSQSSQFFTSNVQGPPPGLKASGTPPVSGGMTFGQGHGFTTGGLQYGSNVGGRNVNEEMMRDLLRGRNASVTGSDAAKRELHPYPYPNTSGGVGYSTSPYPSSASAQYASSMSSFGGDGEKQRSKKKGKKHRHANTGSSSGGAGLVDAVDGHLLQSRLQHSTHSGGQFMSTPPPGAGGMYNPSIHGGNGYGGRWA